jgi:hypothetical protein
VRKILDTTLEEDALKKLLVLNLARDEKSAVLGFGDVPWAFYALTFH